MMKTAADATTEKETETTLDTNEPVTPPHVFITSFFSLTLYPRLAGER